MAESHDRGKQGEGIAASYLVGKGYEILETNWQSNHQEIDIIARKDSLLLIVEVKSRSTNCHGEPEVFVTRQKQRMLIKAANHYIARNQLETEIRFDIISILFRGGYHRLNHIEDAFYAF